MTTFDVPNPLPAKAYVGSTALWPGIPTEFDTANLSILLETDFTDRPDIIDHANNQNGPVLGTAFRVSLVAYGDGEYYGFTYHIHFDSDLDPVSVTSNIHADAVPFFQHVECISIAPLGEAKGDGQACIITGNDLDHWRDFVADAGPLVLPECNDEESSVSSPFDEAASNALQVEVIGETISSVPGTPELWAKGHNAVVLGVDFAGREDITYHTMMNAGALTTTEATLTFSDPGDGTHVEFVYTMAFTQPDIEPLAVAGLANAETISWFQAVDHLWIAPIASVENGQAALHVLVSNAPDRWRKTCPTVKPLTR